MLDDDGKEEVSGCEDHSSENSESDSDFEEEVEIELATSTMKASQRTSRSAARPEQTQLASKEIWI